MKNEKKNKLSDPDEWKKNVNSTRANLKWPKEKMFTMQYYIILFLLYSCAFQYLSPVH